jgi:coniferyl-aldehyde dehydrogenase
VADDFDLAVAAERILFVKYLNAGQICTSVDHVYVPQAKVAAFLDLARQIVPRRYADLASPDYTSIIDRRAYERLKRALDDARARGAQVEALVPGPAFDDERHRIAPHIVVGAPADAELMQREIFGPILPVLGYQQLDEVVAQINAGPRPLAIYPFSHRRETLDHLIEHVMSGGVTINDALVHVGQDDLPFGGVGDSGMGHYHGAEGFNTFSKLRPIFRQSRWSTLKLLFPPYGRWADRILAFLTR